jgi:hypothetical protein
MNSTFFIKSNKSNHSNSHNITYTPIKIKILNDSEQSKIKDNINNIFKRPNSHSNNPLYLNINNNNTIKSNNAFSSRESKKGKKYKLINSSNQNISITENNQMKERNSFILNDSYFKPKENNKNKINKSENNCNRFMRWKIRQYNKGNKPKESKLTYNFIKDTKRFHYSTFIFNEENNNNKRYESNLFSNFLYNSKKAKDSLKNTSFKKNLNSKTMKKKCLTSMNDKIYKHENAQKNKGNARPKSSNIYQKDLNGDKKLKLKIKLIDSPDSIMHYFYYTIKDKRNEDNIKHKIYYSKVDMIKKFRYFKKGLEKIEQRTNFELFNLKRQIIPENELKLTKKFFSHS